MEYAALDAEVLTLLVEAILIARENPVKILSSSSVDDLADTLKGL